MFPIKNDVCIFTGINQNAVSLAQRNAPTINQAPKEYRRIFSRKVMRCLDAIGLFEKSVASFLMK